MSENYTRDQLKIAVGKILQTLGWNSINSTPLEILTDILKSYMLQVTRITNSYANEFGCTQANLDHLGLTFRDMGVNVAELEEYVKYVNFGPPPTPVPKYPILKEDHLNFLKPGSKEVVTRPVHIHEHLPPMNPLLEGIENAENVGTVTEEKNDSIVENGQMFKKPADILPSENKKTSLRREEESSRPTREISSVMMTTSGFLSPAREGKLPESRTPVTAIDQIAPPLPPPSLAESTEVQKKPPKVIKKTDHKKMKPSGAFSEVSSTTGTEEKKKKMASMKYVLKSKQNKAQNSSKPQNSNSTNQNNPSKNFSGPKPINHQNKLNKALAAARLKTERLNTTITPITIKPVSPQTTVPESDNVGKLFTEPDKKKVNIFKKISNVKNEKSESKLKRDDPRHESRESSPDLIIDEPEDLGSKLTLLTNDVTIEPINGPVLPPSSPEKIFNPPYFDDDSRPGTPSTPKTPEMISHSPPLVKEKRKRKDSSKRIKKMAKQSPHPLDPDVIDNIEMERPKTPEAQGLPKMEPPIPSIPPLPNCPPFFFGGPGLIPPPLANPLFPQIPFPPMNLPHFGQKPAYIPPGLMKMNSPIGSNINSNTNLNPNISTPCNIPTPSKPDENLVKTNEKQPPTVVEFDDNNPPKADKKSKEHKKEKKDKKRNKKDKIKNKAEKKKLKEEKKDRLKKEKKEKRKDKELKESKEPKENKEFKESKEGDNLNVKITLKLKSPSPRPETPETRKLNIKPIVRKDEEQSNPPEERKREASPALARISALVCGPPKPKTLAFSSPTAEDSIQEDIPLTPAPRTGPGPGRPRIHPLKSKSLKPKKRRTPVKKDAEGNEVWICPACGRQDDGSPMIGCDGCDAWYHWVCVGIQVPPDDSEDWYCRHCLSKKNEDLQSDKQKKKRKKREKKDH